MTLIRPKILTAVVFDSAQAWDIDVSDVAQYDTNLTGTIAAGTYFVSGDNQSDCLLRALVASIQAELTGGPGGNRKSVADIHPTTHKVRLNFDGSDFDGTPGNNVRVNLTSWGTDLAAALGFDTSADVTSTGTNQPVFTADWVHGYGWYSDEDGQINDIRAVDTPMTFTLQSTSISGKVKSQFFGDRYVNAVGLQFLERYEQSRTKVFSDGKGYGEAPLHPYNRNEPLECWWHEAKKGTRFRVYRDGRVDVGIARDLGTTTAANVTTITDANKAWTTEPSRWVGALVGLISYGAGANDLTQTFYISANTATALTVANAHPSGYDADGGSGGAAGELYYIFDHQYQTYVVDLDKMESFRPRERRKIDRYDITIPLKRYVA